MKKYIKDHLFQLIYLIPVSFIAIGSFVLNIYLNQFGIIDIALFDSRTIFVGFITVFQLLSFLVVLCTLIGKLDSFHDVIVLIICVFGLPILFSILVYMYSGNLNNLETVIEDCKYRLLKATSASGIITFLYFLGNRNVIQNFKTSDKSNKISICIMTTLEIILLTTASFISCKDNVFKEFYKVYLYYGITSIPFIVSVLGDGFPFVNRKANLVLFKYDGKPIKIDYCFIILYLLVLFMITLNNYSKNIFPYISNNMGGGYYKYNTIILEDDSIISGKIIHSNSEYIYCIEEEDKLSQYPIDKIKAYTITKVNDITEEVISETEIEVVKKEQIPEIIKSNENTNDTNIIKEAISENEIEVIEKEQVPEIIKDDVEQ